MMCTLLTLCIVLVVIIYMSYCNCWDYLLFWGVWGAPPGGRAGSENNTLLPMTMIGDRLKFWSGPASVKSYHPETLAAEEEKK